MHEIAISETICKIIIREAKIGNIEEVSSARLRIGKMAAFDRKNLDLCLEGHTKDKALAKTKFEIEAVPVALKCNGCKHTYIDYRFDDFDFAHKTAHAPGLYIPPECPSCKKQDAGLISGQEIELVSIEGE